MEIFLTSISGILVILGMILVGFVMGEKGWMSGDEKKSLKVEDLLQRFRESGGEINDRMVLN